MSDKNNVEFKVPSRMNFPDSLDSTLENPENLDVLKHLKGYVFSRRDEKTKCLELLAVIDSSEIKYNKKDMLESFGESDNHDFDQDEVIDKYIKSTIIKIAYETRQKDLKVGDLMMVMDIDDLNDILNNDTDDCELQLTRQFDLPENSDKVRILTEDDFTLALRETEEN